MVRFTGYAIFFVILVLLQILFFDNLNLSVYIYPLVYVAFLLLLPVNIHPLTSLLLGLLTGVTMDLLTASGGLHTIASLATGFARPIVLRFMMAGKHTKERAIPSPESMGAGRFLKFCLLLTGLHCLLFFSVESLSWSYYYLTLIKIVVSTLLTTALVWLSRILLPASIMGHSSE